MNKHPDDLNQLEDDLRSIYSDMHIPSQPDVRGRVQARLRDLDHSDEAMHDHAFRNVGDTGDASVFAKARPGGSPEHPKSVKRQLLEMAAAAVVLILFTGAMVLVFQNQSPQSGNTSGSDEPTSTSEMERDDSDSMDAFLSDATAIDDIVATVAPFPAPASCDVSEPLGAYEYRSIPGNWYVGDGLYASSREVAMFEGGNLFHWQTESGPSADIEVRVDGERTDEDSDALPYVWFQPTGNNELIRGYLSFPGPGCWDVSMESNRGERLDATFYAYPRYEREINAEQNLGVTIQGASSEIVEGDDHHRIELELRHPDVPELEQLLLEDVLDVVWVESEDGSRETPEGIDFPDPETPAGAPAGNPLDVQVPRHPDEPLLAAFIYVTDKDATDFDLVIDLPDDHPDPEIPDVYRVNFEELIDSTDSDAEPTPTIIPTGPLPEEDREDLSTDDVRIEVPEEQMLALAVQRWIDDRRVMSVFDLDGNLLREFDEIPNIESDDFPPTIVADVSPDGQSVVYQQNDDGGGSDIVVQGADGEEPRQLTTTGDNYRPMWSPDGDQIAFLSDRAHGEERHEYQRGEIFVMNRDGSDFRQLSATPYGAGQIKWSHDGSMIVFASPGFHSGYLMDEGDPPEFPYQLYIADVNSGEQRELTGATIEHLAGFGLSAQPWLTDNSGVLFERSEQVYLTDAEGGGAEIIDDIPVGEEGHQRWADVSPDGKTVAFNWTMDDDSSPVGILDLESGEVSALGDPLPSASHRGWSPDGSFLAAMTAGEPPEDYPEQLTFRDVWIVSPDDGSAQRIATGASSTGIRWLLIPRE